MTNKVASLEKELRAVNKKIDDADAYERKDSVILSGPAITPMEDNENTPALVEKLLKDHMDIEITNHDISITHRLGPMKSSAPRKRNIYVKFVRRQLKKQVVQKSKTAGKNSPLHAFESLTPLRRKMLGVLRRMKSNVPTVVKGFTSIDGKVFAYTPPVAGNTRDQKHHIEDWESLASFCRDHVKQALDDFLQENQ